MTRSALAAVAVLSAFAVFEMTGCSNRRTLSAGGTLSGTIGKDPVDIRLDADGPVEIELDQRDRDLALVSGKETYDSRETGPETILLENGFHGMLRIQPVLDRIGDSPWALRVKSAAIPHFAERRRAVEKLKEAKAGLDLKNPKPALDALSESERLSREAADTEAEATAISYQGTVHALLDDFDRAIPPLAKACEMLEHTRSDWILTECVSNLGWVYTRQGRVPEADRYLRKALEIHARLENQRGEAATLSNLAMLHRDSGQFSNAVELHGRALRIAIQIGDAPFEATIRNNIGLVQQDLGNRAEAEKSLREAKAIYEKAGNQRSAARAALLIAEMRVAAGESPDGLEEAVRIATAGKDSRVLTGAGRLRARIATARGEPAEAERLLRAALEAPGIPSPTRAGILHDLGTALGPKGDAELSEALAIRKKIGARDRAAETLFQLALNARESNRSGRARSLILEAIDTIEQTRALVRGPAHRISYLAARRRYYSFAVDLLATQGLAAEALEVAERGRSRALLDQLGETAADVEAMARPEKTAERERLASQIRLLSLRLEEGRETAEKLRASLAELLDAYNRAESDVYTDSPELARLRPPPLTAAGIMAQLEPGAVLIQYFLGDRGSYRWTVRRTGMRIDKLPARSEVEKTASDCAGKWSENTTESGCRERLSALLPPEAATASRVIVAPDGALHRLPFAALIPDPVESVAAEPSLSVLAAARRRPAPNAGASAPVILADAVFEPDDSRLPSPKRPDVTGPFQRLGFSRREAMALGKILPGAQTRFGFDVTRDFVAGGGLANAGMVHIATHAVADEAQPELSRLILSQFDAAGKPVEGRMLLPEIARLKLRARLVTLSACSAGKGARAEGEGPIHVARAILQAGASAVVVSLWDADDEATADLMRRFYERMSGPKPQPPAAALLAAQRELSREARWKHPYYWAGWTLLGEWR